MTARFGGLCEDLQQLWCMSRDSPQQWGGHATDCLLHAGCWTSGSCRQHQWLGASTGCATTEGLLREHQALHLETGTLAVLWISSNQPVPLSFMYLKKKGFSLTLSKSLSWQAFSMQPLTRNLPCQPFQWQRVYNNGTANRHTRCKWKPVTTFFWRWVFFELWESSDLQSLVESHR